MNGKKKIPSRTRVHRVRLYALKISTLGSRDYITHISCIHVDAVTLIGFVRSNPLQCIALHKRHTIDGEGNVSDDDDDDKYFCWPRMCTYCMTSKYKIVDYFYNIYEYYIYRIACCLLLILYFPLHRSKRLR